jgi:hypothetical protein
MVVRSALIVGPLSLVVLFMSASVVMDLASPLVEATSGARARAPSPAPTIASARAPSPAPAIEPAPRQHSSGHDQAGYLAHPPDGAWELLFRCCR